MKVSGLTKPPGYLPSGNIPQQRASFQMQVDLARQLDRPAQINSGGHFTAATCRAQAYDGGLDRKVFVATPSPTAPYFGGAETIIGNDRQRGVDGGTAVHKQARATKGRQMNFGNCTEDLLQITDGLKS